MAASRKLYVELAQTIKYQVQYATPEQVETIRTLVVDLCGDLKRDNTAFNRDKFMTACGLS
jgi:hypothetical protein